MLYTPSKSILKGNTIAFTITVYDEEGVVTDANEVKVRVVRGQQVVEPMIETSVEHTDTGSYRYLFHTSDYGSGEYTAIWRGNIINDDGQKIHFVTQETVGVQKGRGL